MNVYVIAASFFHHPIMRDAGGNNVPMRRWTSIKRIKCLLVLNEVIGRRRLRDKSRQFRRQRNLNGIGPFKSPVRRRINSHARVYRLAPHPFRQLALVKLQINAETCGPRWKTVTRKFCSELTRRSSTGTRIPSSVCGQVFTRFIIG